MGLRRMVKLAVSCPLALPGYRRNLHSFCDCAPRRRCEEFAVRLRNSGVRKKLPAMLAKFPVRFPAPFPVSQHREFDFKPLQQLHKV
jgi:hypothetical protein